MRVALGTLELDEDTRKKLGKAINGRSYLKREEAKDWALMTLNAEIQRLTGPVQDSQAQEPITAPKDADALPEPAPALSPVFSSATV